MEITEHRDTQQAGASGTSASGVFAFDLNVAGITNPAAGAVTGIVIPAGSYFSFGFRITEEFDNTDDRIIISSGADFTTENFGSGAPSGADPVGGAGGGVTFLSAAGSALDANGIYYAEGEINLRIAVLKYDLTAPGSTTGAGELVVRVTP